MDTSNMGKWGVVSMGLVVAGLWGGFGCNSEPVDPDGSGGATGGQGDGGSGGGSGGGGSGGGSGGGCTNGSGGAIYLPNCDDWLGEREGEELDFSCGQAGNGGQGGNGGEGGAVGGEEPALERLCENESSPDFNRAHPVYHCLAELTDDVCSATHYEDVTACLTQAPPCNADLEDVGCDDIMDECSEIDEGTCYWGMVSARNPDYIETCFAAPANDESCEARFMRCAWGL